MNKKILIIITILAIVIVSVAGAVLAVNFGIFQNEKDAFFKYMAKNSEILELFDDEEINAYIEKSKNTPYTNEGMITYAKNSSTVSENDLSGLNDEISNNDKATEVKIDFDGKVDNQNQKNQQDIKIHYTDDVYFPITYRKVGDLYGLIAPDVITSYLVIENNNLKEFFENLGISDDKNQIPDKIDFKTDIMEFSKEEKEKIKNKYFEILNNNLQKEQFTKSKEENQKIYTLSLTEAQYKAIKVNILTELKQDEIILQKLASSTLKDKFTEYINSILEEEQKESATDKIMNIIEYVEKGKLVKTEIKSEDDSKSIRMYDNETQQVTLTITKVKSGSNTEYDIAINELGKNETINIQLIFSGLQSLYTVKDTLNIEMQSDESSEKLNYQNEKKFAESVEIEDFDENNSFKLNGLTSDQMYTLLQAVIQKVLEVNNDKMEQVNQ